MYISSARGGDKQFALPIDAASRVVRDVAVQRAQYFGWLASAAAFLALSTPACDWFGSGQKPTNALPPAFVNITVIGTSDLHGRLATLPLLGGYVDSIRVKNPDGVVLVDAGDMFQGTLESNLNEGEAVIGAYKKLGYDGVAIGNHEFDYGPEGEASVPQKGAPADSKNDPRGALKARAAQAMGAFPLLAANILEEGKPLHWPNVAPSVIVEKRGVKVGIIGVSTMSTPTTTISANVVGITMKPIVAAIVDEAKALREQGANTVVVAAHAGGACKTFNPPTDLSSCETDAEIFEVARSLPKGTVQVIVAGHTHKSVAHEVAGIPVIQSDAYGAAFGRVDLTVNAATGEVTKAAIFQPEPVKKGAKYQGVELWPPAVVEEVVAPAIERAESKRNEPLQVSLTEPFLSKYRDECSFGNWVTSLLLEVEPKAHIAVANGGGLRADLPAGDLTYGALYDALPFDNRLATMTMKGSAFKSTVIKNLTGKSGILSLGGVRVVGKCESGALQVDVYLTGHKKAERKLKDDEEVTLVTNEFLATQGDGFGPGERVTINEEGAPFRDLIANLLKSKKGTYRPDDWYSKDKPRIVLPGPIGRDICGRREPEKKP
ncbi:MAG: bifunctional metallophosphatase/5'-nucleotidase [Polyangiaceae bacterium]|nr:bifunctional metallophosphatase/5'-nucleotidase [Polyangiaceae bacterium]